MSAKDIFKLMKDKEIEFVDLRFTDPRGKLQHLTMDATIFDDEMLGWAAYENSKKRFKNNQDLWTLQSTYDWANRKINKNRENKNLNSEILINQFFKLTGIKKTKVLFSLNHGWKYSSNSKPLNLKSYDWEFVLIGLLVLD